MKAGFSRMPAELPSSEPPTPTVVPPGRRAAWLWAVCAAAVASLPFLSAIAESRVFYIRDLSQSFWGRYLWLRRALWSGEWPLWDPYVGAGQAAVADGLHQMFLLPALVVRLIGTEVLGFDLWVALPFPLAALGAWCFLARRFSAPASTLGAIAFAVSGPIVSTGNFPNMSWSVAFLPWVVAAVDRVLDTPTPRRVAALAIAVGLQALSGEPVTLLATLVVSSVYAFLHSAASATATARRKLTEIAAVALGLAIGLALSAIQLVPMAQAAAQSGRAGTVDKGFWSLHPLGLLEALAFQLFGNFYTSQSVAALPWMPLLNSGREPFFISMYLGVPLLAVAVLGVAGSRERRWLLFWVAAAAASLICAFGTTTPVYPFLKDHLPLLRSFRFPVKYLVVCSMTLAAATAAGWDALHRAGDADGPGLRRARLLAITFALAVGLAAYAAAGACLYFPKPAVFYFYDLARALGSRQAADAAEFMLRALPRVASWVLLLSVAAAALIFLAGRSRREASFARPVLYLLVVTDLLVRAWGINPAFDSAYALQPEWVSRVKATADARFYIGGKYDGTIQASDPDAPRAFVNPAGMIGSASRGALNNQIAMYPSGWHAREMLSYDLAVLWPRIFDTTTTRFQAASPEERARFLDRTGVRFRILPRRRAAGHEALTKIPYFLESFLFDWGAAITPRATVVSDATIVGDLQQQIDALFQDGWNNRTTVLVDRPSPAAGDAGEPVSPYASFVTDAAHRLVVNAGAGASGGYLVVLDSYSDDWHATVDGHPATIVRANALFRAVRLVPGRHAVELRYRPRAFLWGAAGSGGALLVTLALLTLPSRRTSEGCAS